MDLSQLHTDAKIASNYDLNEEQENKKLYVKLLVCAELYRQQLEM